MGEKLNELALFAGAGGGILGGTLLGWRTVCAVEINSFCARRLMQRQNEGHLPPFPIWDDVCTFDGAEWKGYVDVVSGGFPCQDISSAGKGAGLDGEKSSLWREMRRIVDEIRPPFAFVENSPLLRGRGLDRVLSDLAEMGYDAEWICLGGREVGASHKRERIWILASNSNSMRLQRNEQSASIQRLPYIFTPTLFPRNDEHLHNPRIIGTSNGVAARVDRTCAINNGQIPAVAATAWNILRERLIRN